MDARSLATRIAVLFTTALLMAPSAQAQVQPGMEIQIYPAGVIIALKAVFSVNDSNAFELMAGYNWTARRDWGEHDDERGAGPGLSAAWRVETGSFYAGGRADLWYLDVAWRQNEGLGRSGASTVWVVQPTLRAGYTRPFRGHRLDFGAALGREINVLTRGEEVGQGAIFLVGVSVVR
ncbi:hypothetical protein JYT20_01375 [Rhodothermus sp. AH-315-K08]|nr:hypothetical protein [Rhodothermus sp. AH-315-K08]